jgi:hypothetical protein
MDIARINISAMASFLAARDSLPGPAAYWHDTRERIAAAVGPDRLVGVVRDGDDVRLFTADGDFQVRNPAPGSYRMLGGREAADAWKKFETALEKAS